MLHFFLSSVTARLLSEEEGQGKHSGGGPRQRKDLGAKEVGRDRNFVSGPS